MIRLPPSALQLGVSDVRDYEKRQQARRRKKCSETSSISFSININISDQFSRIGIRASNDDKGGTGRVPQSQRSRHSMPEGNDFRKTITLPTPSSTDTVPVEVVSPDTSNSLCLTSDLVIRSPSQASSTSSQELSVIELEGDEHGYVNVRLDQSPENAHHDLHRVYSPSKDDFYYGGFIETPTRSVVDDTTQSPLTPNDASTTQQLQPPSSHRLRPRALPRSPLFLSQNASTSPERRPTSNLTPHVASRVTHHHTPSILFSQPPRRPPRPGGPTSSTRTLRHQTNSFSFDSSERSSAAYEQERVVSSSSNGIARGSAEVNLHDDLRGSSLQSSRNPSAESSGFPGSHEIPDEHESTALPGDPDQKFVNYTSPSRFWTAESQSSLGPDKRAGSGPRFEPTSMKSSYEHAGSPQTTSPSASPTPRHERSREVSGELGPMTPSRTYQIYNDALSPDIQPQTPANLPESRHQSRYHPSYTAPVTRAVARRGAPINNSDGEGMAGIYRRRQVPFYTPMRGGRPPSPIGLTQGGFQGLYGGRENGDDEQSWVDGVRFNNAETRLWGARDAQNEGGNLRSTPEPDEWRVGRRN
ncbi:hypothetical protein MBM_07371 [Drepanopeziza brunnea f. sp. 'multigermtubi' MB_m1]|uniref:Uncharacterized protein n=1 Tax=Marssonina brunnea f. sp. multigermtubi (strain MB_m1) TaxID=1072389 RepID=K1WBI5_MARBU|nr:uncharacterized protein MBM_07371 [Drepanopeziza brunnea f. sp. 'multigermtubi' MB_m1]EKD14650.1 hypothetical protein MBM_07371 [Drepanopeziza brunnea f. sp. 'multigermtubi' MB_m1]